MGSQKSHLSGPQEQRLEELLGRYVEELLVHGVRPDPEELCWDCPELLGPLRECIQEYERLNRILGPPEGLAGRLREADRWPDRARLGSK